MLMSIGLQSGMFALNAYRYPEMREMYIIVYAFVPTIILSTILILGIFKRRKWARTGYLIWFILSFVCVSAMSLYSKKLMLIEKIIMYWIVDVVVLCLLFKKESSAWFRATT